MLGVDLYPPLIPYALIGFAFLLPLLRVLGVKRSVSRDLALIATLAALYGSLEVYRSASSGVLVYTIGGFPIPVGIAYVVDGFSALFGLLIATLFAVLTPVSPVFVEDNEYFYSALLGLEAGLLGVVYTGDVFNMFVMLEVFTISAFVLISASKTRGAYRATITYAIVGMVAGTLFFFAAVLIYYVAGSLNIGHVAAMVSGIAPPAGRTSLVQLAILMPLFIITWSMLAESAISPLHFWLPEAYTHAPPVVSSLLSGLAEGVAFYVIARVYYTIYSGIPPYIQLMLSILGGLTVGVAGAGLLASKDLLKVAGYTVILDSGFMALALSMGARGLPVLIAYAIAHAFVKPIIFLVGGYATRLRVGVLRKSWPLAASFMIGVLNIVGVPPTALFMAKLQLYQVALESLGSNSVPALITLVSLPVGSVMALIGFMKVLPPLVATETREAAEKPPRYLMALVLYLALASLLLGILYNQVQAVVSSSVESMLNRLSYIGSALGKTTEVVYSYG
ncbi:proton-conducting transporter membrane subunit [Thermogladius calderae]|uniref:proton-conducting transporter transmembrane domain-containing protein n=1 Tax=Thermogladius calderae TaxID=1200300 RepID=UPI00064E2B5F|nr:proton-conducting transporter membrane subunit [Thermogladius calderae]